MSRRKPRLRRTARAEEDSIDIWTYIARHNSSAADRLLDLLDEKSRSLARNPRLGAAREDVAPGVRHLPVGRYLILSAISATAWKWCATSMECAGCGICFDGDPLTRDGARRRRRRARRTG
ncbi:MAG: type II toxin-antitoxin system RelE/ParE family toxin [Rhodoplanes sp.]